MYCTCIVCYLYSTARPWLTAVFIIIHLWPSSTPCSHHISHRGSKYHRKLTTVLSVICCLSNGRKRREKVKGVTQFPDLDTWTYVKRPLLNSLGFDLTLMLIYSYVTATDEPANVCVSMTSINPHVLYSLNSSRSQPVCWMQPSLVPWGHLSYTATTSLWSMLLLWWVTLLGCLG